MRINKKELLLIDKLADIPAESDATFSTAEASVFVSRAFLDSELFKSYLQHRGATMLKQAKTSACNKRRMELLRQLRGMASVLDKDSNETAEEALMLFDEKTSIAERARYMSMCLADDLQPAVEIAIA